MYFHNSNDFDVTHWREWLTVHLNRFHHYFG